MGLSEYCAFMTFYEDNQLVMLGDILLQKQINKETYKKILPENLDEKLLDLYDEVTQKHNLGKTLNILTIPGLDKRGHDFGPHTPQIISHLKTLDRRLSNTLREREGIVLLTGDHGCRCTTEYVIELDESQPTEMNVYVVQWNGMAKFKEHYAMEKTPQEIQYDGGILRLWFDSSEEKLAARDERFLAQYGTVLSQARTGELNTHIQQVYQNSLHENLGQVTILANPAVTFCKQKWVEKHILEIRQRQHLEHGILPVGEHGSTSEEDMRVGFFSNFNLGKEQLYNIEIRKIIEQLRSAQCENAKSLS